MSFLESPALQQNEIANKLAAIDTGYHDPHLFWGRWADSKWDTGGLWSPPFPVVEAELRLPPETQSASGT